MTDLLIYLLLGAIPAAMIAFVLNLISGVLQRKRFRVEFTEAERSARDAERAARDVLSEHERLLADDQRLVLGAQQKDIENRESAVLIERLRAATLRESREVTAI